jgi:hypothetical protein
VAEAKIRSPFLVVAEINLPALAHGFDHQYAGMHSLRGGQASQANVKIGTDELLGDLAG